MDKSHINDADAAAFRVQHLVSSGGARTLAVTRLVPLDWEWVRIRGLEESDSRITIEIERVG